MARPAGLEPATLGLEGRCSIRLSYGRSATDPADWNWSGQRDSNPRPSAPKADALPGCAMPRVSQRTAQLYATDPAGRAQDDTGPHGAVNCTSARVSRCSRCATIRTPIPRTGAPMSSRQSSTARRSPRNPGQSACRSDARAARPAPPGPGRDPGRRRPGIAIYVRNKRRACEEAGIESRDYDLPDDHVETDMLALIDELNGDRTTHGILVQLPLPGSASCNGDHRAIDPIKDVDGFHPYTVGRLAQRIPVLRPCTPTASCSCWNASA